MTDHIPYPQSDPSPGSRPAASLPSQESALLLHTAAHLSALSSAGQRAVVMTMGALHEGHAALVRAARARVGVHGQVVVTVFVNPLQFGAGEDLDRYPRTLEADLRVASEAGADVVFAPSADEVYPGGEPQVRIAAGPLGECLEGEFRPGHFDGMLTVVAKLLHLTAPDVALYGEKDAQQLALIRVMARDLNFPVEIIGVPTVREPDGLALSSRNRFLTAGQRQSALALSRALLTAARQADPASALATARQLLADAEGLEIDYIALVDPTDFTELPDASVESAEAETPTTADQAGTAYVGQGVLAVAARVGSTRLIDNVRITFGSST